MTSSLISLFHRDEDKGLQEWRIRNILLNICPRFILFSSPAEFFRQYQECSVKKHFICPRFILFPSPAEFLRQCQECSVKKHFICPRFILFSCPAEFLRQYRIQCAQLHAECVVVTFCQLQSRALPDRAPIPRWSGYKTGLVLDILALLLFLFLDLVPRPWVVGTVVKKGGQLIEHGVRGRVVFPPSCVDTFLSVH